MASLGNNIKPLPMNSIGRDRNRAKEEYDHEEKNLKQQITQSNIYNLFFLHEPHRQWHRENSNEVFKGNENRSCRICKSNYKTFFLSLTIYKNRQKQLYEWRTPHCEVRSPMTEKNMAPRFTSLPMYSSSSSLECLPFDTMPPI